MRMLPIVNVAAHQCATISESQLEGSQRDDGATRRMDQGDVRRGNHGPRSRHSVKRERFELSISMLPYPK